MGSGISSVVISIFNSDRPNRDRRRVADIIGRSASRSGPRLASNKTL